MQCKAIIHKHTDVSVFVRHLKNVFFKVAGAEIRRVVEDVPLVPAVMWHISCTLDFGTVRNATTTLPAIRSFFLSRNKLAAIDGGDRDVLAENDLWTECQEVEIMVRNQPLVRSSRSNSEHEVDSTLGGTNDC